MVPVGDGRKLAILAAYIAVGIFLSYCFGDAIFAAGGEGLTVAAGLAYFGLFALAMERWG